MKKCLFATKALSATLVATMFLSPAVSLYAAVPDAQTYDEAPFVQAENGDLYLNESFQDQSDLWLDDTDFSGISTTAFANEYSAQSVLVSPENSSDSNSESSTDASSSEAVSSESDISSDAATSIPDDSSTSSSDSSSESNLSDDAITEYPNTVEGFVERLYELVLGRTGDPTGTANWTNGLNNKTYDAAWVSVGFFHSSEFKNKNLSDGEYLEILYHTMLNRSPDQSGYDNWMEALDAGVSRDYILRYFVASPEFTSICKQFSISRGDITLTQNRDKNLAVTRFVSRFYKSCFNRKGDENGLNLWTGKLLNQNASGSSIAVFFFTSAEYLSKNSSNEEFLESAYQAMLGRSIDSVGLSTWLASLNKGHSRSYILSMLAGSAEFNKLCKETGISVGSIQTEPRDKNEAATELIQRSFASILDRPIDVKGLNEYSQNFLNGQTAMQYFAALFGSQEFKNRKLNNTQIVETVYKAMLNRNPSGVTTSLGFLERYASTLYIVRQIGLSAEFKNICNRAGIAVGSYILTEARDQNLDVTDVAVNAYKSLLGNVPDVNKLNELCKNLTGKNAQSVLNTLYGLTTSTEFKSRNLDSRGYVVAIFSALCGRAPTEAEISVWLNLLSPDDASTRKTIFFLLGNSSPCSSYLGPKLGISTFNTQEKGIDVSAHQGVIDWSKVASEGYTFAFIRAVSSTNAGPYLDPYFYQNVRKAKAAGLKVGVYFYSYAKTTDYISQEVTLGLNAIRVMENEGYRFDYPVVLDMEEFKTSGPNWSAIAILGLTIIDQKGYYPCLYSYANAFKNGILNMNDPGLKGYDLWVAHYGVSAMSYPGAIWQYTSSGSVPGVNGRCDLNISYRDFATIIRNAGKNNLR